MPHFLSDDGVELFYEDRGPDDPDRTGHGVPLVFVHEFGGDWRSWRRQVEAFRARWRCITPCARGFHPSAVPEDPSAYGQERATGDLLNLLDHLQLPMCHLVGSSMGSFTSLCLALAQRTRVASLLLVGLSSGPRDPEERAAQRAGWVGQEIRARETDGAAGAVAQFVADPTMQNFRRKDPEGWADYAASLRGQSVAGALHVLGSVQWNRESLWDRAERLEQLSCPLLAVWGANDFSLVAVTGRFLEAQVPGARCAVFPETGHLVNLEEPDAFNALMADFYARQS